MENSDKHMYISLTIRKTETARQGSFRAHVLSELYYLRPSQKETLRKSIHAPKLPRRVQLFVLFSFWVVWQTIMSTSETTFTWHAAYMSVLEYVIGGQSRTGAYC